MPFLPLLIFHSLRNHVIYSSILQKKMLMKDKPLYYAILYKGIHCQSEFVKCFIPYDSLHKMLIVCNSALSTLFALSCHGFLKVYRDKEFIGYYDYDQNSNTFTFVSNSLFPNSSKYLKQVLKKNERIKQENPISNS